MSNGRQEVISLTDHYHQPEQIAAITEMLKDITTQTYSQPESRPAYHFQPKDEVIDQWYEDAPPEHGIGFQAVLQRFQNEIMPCSPQTWHPHFMNQMFSGASFPAIAGEMLAGMMNPTLATFEMAPIGTIMEKMIAQWMAQLLGMPQGSGGIFLPGGSISNLLAMTIARNNAFDPECSNKGVDLTRKPVILCSEASHYSIANAGNLLGIGKDRVIKIKVNNRNEMLIEDLKVQLRRCDEQGLTPFAVVATMGITVTGCFDPLGEIAAICKPRGIHVHADAAFGGTMALTSSAAQVFQGIDQVDSVTWDAHKWLPIPITCSVLLVPNPQILKSTFSSNANYLFHPQEDSLHLGEDLGHATILCGKRFDALKIWMLWKTFGTRHFRDLAESRLNLALEFYHMLDDDPDFVPSYQPRSPIVCFRYRPPQLAEKKLSTDQWNNLHRFIRESCKKRGLGFFNISKIGTEDHFRMILINPLSQKSHLTGLTETIKNLGQEYARANFLLEE